MSGITIGIIGSRRRNTEDDYFLLFDGIWDIIVNYCITHKELEYKDITIVTGDCDEGGDKFARERIPKDYKGAKLIVKRIKDPETGEEMDFKRHRWFEYNTMCKIFYSRNKEVAKEPLDYLIALVAPDRKGGTENTIYWFKRHHPNCEFKLILI